MELVFSRPIFQRRSIVVQNHRRHRHPMMVLAALLPKETLLCKLNMLKVASKFANSHLHAVKAQTLVLSRRDQLLPSEEEGQRLNRVLPKCQNRSYIVEVVVSARHKFCHALNLAGIPSEGPVLFIGYHMLMGFELAPMEVAVRPLIARIAYHPSRTIPPFLKEIVSENRKIVK
ncbi:hypothetical protein D5086_002838 [Populus alba]|uniref:Uncharacterized protein n=1 Tax=Populus alba TaxID=43335 RepID=A0ACC4D355_POPAL